MGTSTHCFQTDTSSLWGPATARQMGQKIYGLHTVRKIPFMYSFPGNCAASVPISHSCDCERFIYSQDLSAYFPAAEQADQSRKYINLSQINECRNSETEHYISVLELTLYFWEYINGNQTFILDSHRPFICSVCREYLLFHLLQAAQLVPFHGTSQ